MGTLYGQHKVDCLAVLKNTGFCISNNITMEYNKYNIAASVQFASMIAGEMIVNY